MNIKKMTSAYKHYIIAVYLPYGYNDSHTGLLTYTKFNANSSTS